MRPSRSAQRRDSVPRRRPREGAAPFEGGCLSGLSVLAVVAAPLFAMGCYRHAELPASPPSGALAGRAPAGFDTKIACGQWTTAVGEGDPYARAHDSFPEVASQSCYVPVRYTGELARPDPAPPGCEYPTSGALPRLRRERERYERIAKGEKVAELPAELACEMEPRARAAAAAQNARAFARVEADLAAGKTYPYSAVAAFGFGHKDQGASVLRGHLPGEACRRMSKDDLDLLTINVTRSGRGALAVAGRVAPVLITSGGAVHSPIVEAFAMEHLAVCRFGVAPDRVIVDPCADHTHTNVKHTAGLVVALGGRTAYVVTDDGIQADYLEEWTFFDLLGGSIDQRSLRDFGYVLATWRRASVGMRAGFWLSPYRFFAEPRGGLGDFACARPPE